MKKSLLVVAFTSLSLIGCASKPTPRPEIYNLPSLEKGYSRMYFSAGEMVGLKLWSVHHVGPVFLDGKQVGSTAKNEHTVVDVKPGAHEIYCNPEAPQKNYIEKLTTTIKEGETRHLACDMKWLGGVSSEYMSKTFYVERALDSDSKLVDYKIIRYKTDEDIIKDIENNKKSIVESNKKIEENYNELTKESSDLSVINSIKAFKKVSVEGYNPDILPGISKDILVVTSDGSFSVSIDTPTELPWKFTNVKSEEAKEFIRNHNKECVLLIQLAPGRVERKETNNSKISSKYIADYLTEPNPDYEVRQREYDFAVGEYNRAMLQSSNNKTNTTNVWAAALSGALQGASNATYASAVDQAKARLLQTSPTRRVPITKDYQYDKMTISIQKLIPIELYILDNKKVYKFEFSLNERKNFNVVYNKRQDDDGTFVSSDNEKDIISYEKEKFTVKESQIIEKLLTNSTYITIKNDNKFSFVGKQDKSIQNTEYKFNDQSDGKISNLMNSVVAIQDNGKKTIGTGFFVRDNIVVTNKHVIENNNYITLKTKSGKTHLGKVLDSSNEIDLAIIQVEGTGRPVKFYDKEVEAGEDVLAIGNPLGFEYSLTKGIVSGVRTSKDENRPLSKEHTYIQTDVPINPGNSGGPLFIDGKVAGVNTLKIVNKSVEGIGFAIHYKEIINYLNSVNQTVSQNIASSELKVNKDKVVKKANNDIEPKLEKLKNLYDSKLITDEEYKAKKQEILNKL